LLKLKKYTELKSRKISLTHGQKGSEWLLLESINLRRENEIALGQTVNLVCPDSDLRPSPTVANVWMVPLLFGEFGHAIHKRLRIFEVRKLVFFAQVMLRDNFPTINLRLQLCDLLPSQWWHSTAAGNTSSAG
jgi:hypothetical protein